MLLLVLTTLSSAPLVDTPPRPPVMVIPVLAVTELKLTAEDVVSAFCFAPIVVITSCPPTYRGPPMMALLEHKIEPLQSNDGALMDRKNVAEALSNVSRTRPFGSESCKL